MQCHEPPGELSTETFVRMIATLTQEAEAINWDEQHVEVELDGEAGAIVRDAQHESFKHLGMDLEFLLRRTPARRATL